MARFVPQTAFSPPAQAAAVSGLQPEAAGSSGFLFWATAILLFTHFARPFDTVLVGFHIPAVICSIGIVVALLSGGLTELRSNIGISCLLLVGWMCLSAPFSIWKGGTFVYVMWFAELYLPLMILVAAASKTPRDIVKLGGIMAFSCLCHLTFNRSEYGGRFSLNGTFGNPDDVALLAGFTIPFLALVASRLRNSVVRYGLLFAGSGYLLWLIGTTATRAAVPALIAMLAVYVFRVKGPQRAAIVVFAGLGALFLILFLPKSTVERFSTVVEAFDPAKGYSGMNEAQASAIERHELLKDSIIVTLQHPFVGVGAGMFTQYRWDKMLASDGTHKPYLPTHNTFLEISSQCGIPCVAFYLIFLWLIYRQIRATQKLTSDRASPQSDLIWSITLCLEVALVYFVVCAAFMTCDTHPHQFVLAGFAIALQRMTRFGLAGTPAAVSTKVPFPIASVPLVGKGPRPYPLVAR